MVLQLLLTLPVGACSCDAVELSFSCLRCLKNLEQRREKGLWERDDLHCLMDKSNAVSLPPLFCHPGCETDDGSV